MLAWLIDFRHRPYSSDNHVDLDEEELAIIDGEEFQFVLPQRADSIGGEKGLEIKPIEEKGTEKIPDNQEDTGDNTANNLPEVATEKRQLQNAHGDIEKTIPKPGRGKTAWRRIRERVGIVILTAGICEVNWKDCGNIAVRRYAI